MGTKIVGIDGAVRADSKTRRLLEEVGNSILKRDGDFVLFSQQVHRLPVFDDNAETAQSPAVRALIEAARDADGFVLSSPEYHGSMSGALKNALEWLTFSGYDGVQGRVFGLVGGGGALANSGATSQMMMTVRAMHGWLMPDVVVSVSNIWDVMDSEEQLEKLRSRVDSFADKMVAYSREFKAMRDRLAA